MSTELALYATLVAWGNDFLTSGRAAPELFPGNTVFAHVKDVEFPEGSKGTAAWYESVARAGVRKMSLHATDPDVGAFAFANADVAGIWLENDHLERVRATSLLTGERKAPWRLQFTRDIVVDVQLPGSTSLDDAARELAAALENAIAFARRELANWVADLEDARQRLEDETAEIPYYTDLLPPSADPRARRLAAAAFAGWVFGGMGSWNDSWFEDRRVRAEHDRLTVRLLRVETRAIEAAANAGPGPPGSATIPPT